MSSIAFDAAIRHERSLTWKIHNNEPISVSDVQNASEAERCGLTCYWLIQLRRVLGPGPYDPLQFPTLVKNEPLDAPMAAPGNPVTDAYWSSCGRPQLKPEDVRSLDEEASKYGLSEAWRCYLLWRVAWQMYLPNVPFAITLETAYDTCRYAIWTMVENAWTYQLGIIDEYSGLRRGLYYDPQSSDLEVISDKIRDASNAIMQRDLAESVEIYSAAGELLPFGIYSDYNESSRTMAVIDRQVRAPKTLPEFWLAEELRNIEQRHRADNEASTAVSEPDLTDESSTLDMEDSMMETEVAARELGTPGENSE
ncbi:hypothetical protein CkaCkLH20_08433 [Colletotrichum karsti]|uniref:Uncharacterized protein n=1 Tax=Colletotrichum karsti TaxID=1095194 RepID=A0A9P6I337_9PEZI|nr:uncharacterized protein CkaCkLH20_08433 [Colletotrichum karsti]KAF9874061.1 hypothetical protein CkaCkLH20_08433 [Colletotrichum karsti]